MRGPTTVDPEIPVPLCIFGGIEHTVDLLVGALHALRQEVDWLRIVDVKLSVGQGFG